MLYKKCFYVLNITLFSVIHFGLFAQDFWYPYSHIDSVKIWNLVVKPNGDMFTTTINPFSLPNHGGIYRSTNHGASWDNIGPYPYIGGLGLATDNYGSIYISAWDTIYKSLDNGDTWFPIHFPNENYVIKTGYDSIILIGAPENEAIYRSGDYGLTWKKVLSIGQNSFYQWITDFAFSSNGIIYATSVQAENGDDSFFKSEDFGNTWIPIPTDNYGCSYSNSIAEDSHGNILLGSIGEGLFKFYDFTSPIFYRLTPYTTINGIVGTNENIYYLATNNIPNPGYGGCLIFNANDSSWTQQNSGLNLDSQGITIDETGHLLIYGGSNIYRSNDKIINGFNWDNDFSINGYNIYPNPCQDYFIISKNAFNQKYEYSYLIIKGVDGKTYYQENGFISYPRKVTTEKLPKGLFVIIIEDDIQHEIKKFIHQ